MKTVLMIVMAMTVALGAGCLYPGPRGEVVFAPPLPPIVVLDTEPYYVNGGYHYHYQNNNWYYAHSRTGPWAPLPRDRYPREVRYKGHSPDRNDGPKPGHEGR